jgi:hypothetical protein
VDPPARTSARPVLEVDGQGSLGIGAVPSPYPQAAPKLVVNFLPVRFTGETFRGGTMPFEPERLAELRTELRGTHVVRRDGDKIVCVALTSDAPDVGAQEKFTIGDHRGLTMRLVQDALIRELLAMKYLMRKFAPPTFVSRYAQQDLLAQCAAEHRERVAGLHVYPQFKLDTRSSGPSKSPGIIVAVNARFEIDLPVVALIRAGVAMTGRYVLAEVSHLEPNPDLDPLSCRRTVGAVDSVSDMQLNLRDAPHENVIPAEQAWLEGRRDNFNDVLAALTGGQQAALLGRLDEAAYELLGAPGRLAKVTALATRLAKDGPLAIADGVTVDVGLPLGSVRPSRTVPQLSSTRFDPPTFVFDPAGDKTDRSAEKGLAEFGPFDSQSFSPRKPKILVISPRTYQGNVEVFLRQFRDGVPGSKVYTQGFIGKYRLAGCDIMIEPFDGGPCDAAAYKTACLAAIQARGKPDLAMVITSEEQETLAGDASPYLVAKSTLMGQGVPVQEVQIETIRSRDLAYPLDSIALACYAKLGGTPFVMASVRTIAHELVIGIGSASVRETRLGDPERVVGITTVFSADGNYLLSNTSREVDYADYPTELLRALRVTIDDIRRRNAWQPDDTIRLVFHIFKPLKYTEADAVKQLVAELLKDFRSVQFAFVHISTDHDWKLFDTNAAGVGTHRLPSGASQTKGKYVPARGHAVTVGPTEILLTVSGPFDLKRATQGLPRPLLLKLHPASTFADIEYLAEQAFRFTALSWRRPYPSSLPVTISYSGLIASLLGRLRHVRNWNADVIATHLRASRWFL